MVARRVGRASVWQKTSARGQLQFKHTYNDQERTMRISRKLWLMASCAITGLVAIGGLGFFLVQAVDGAVENTNAGPVLNFV